MPASNAGNGSRCLYATCSARLLAPCTVQCAHEQYAPAGVPASTPDLLTALVLCNGPRCDTCRHTSTTQVRSAAQLCQRTSLISTSVCHTVTAVNGSVRDVPARQPSEHQLCRRSCPNKLQPASCHGRSKCCTVYSVHITCTCECHMYVHVYAKSQSIYTYTCGRPQQRQVTEFGTHRRWSSDSHASLRGFVADPVLPASSAAAPI